MTIAIYPGSFDPPTLGHLDVIQRASLLFDRVIVAVGANPEKSPWFTLGERLHMLKECTAHLPNVEVDSFQGLLVEYARRRGAKAIVKGLRAISDFEAEFQMALANRTLAPEIETVFLMTSAEHMFVSSSTVKEIAQLGGDVKEFVPESVARHLASKTASMEVEYGTGSPQNPGGTSARD